MIKELKPCPWCGGDARMVKRDGASLIYCTKCERGTGLCRGDSAETIWNRRPAEDALKAEVARLKQVLCDISKIGFECKIGDKVARETMRRIANSGITTGGIR